MAVFIIIDKLNRAEMTIRFFYTTYWTILSCGLTILFSACFSSQSESFLQLFGLQEKLFCWAFHNRHVEHGMLALLPILIVTMSS